MSQGRTFENLKIENGIESCDFLRRPNGTTKKNWKWENGIETSEPVKRKADTELTSKSKRKKK